MWLYYVGPWMKLWLLRSGVVLHEEAEGGEAQEAQEGRQQQAAVAPHLQLQHSHSHSRALTHVWGDKLILVMDHCHTIQVLRGQQQDMWNPTTFLTYHRPLHHRNYVGALAT